jgi:hypothetical protein
MCQTKCCPFELNADWLSQLEGSTFRAQPITMDLTKVAKLRINNIVDWNRDTSFFTIKHRIINFEDEVKKKREIKLFCRKWLKCIVNKQMLYLLSKDNDGTKYKIQIEVYQSSGTAKIFKKKVNTEIFNRLVHMMLLDI